MGWFSKSPTCFQSWVFFRCERHPHKDLCACQGVWLEVKVITVEVQSSCILVCCHISILLFTCTSRLYWDVLDYNLNVIWVIPPSNSAQNMFSYKDFINLWIYQKAPAHVAKGQIFFEGFWWMNNRWRWCSSCTSIASFSPRLRWGAGCYCRWTKSG